jgi:hypothetical protein
VHAGYFERERQWFAFEVVVGELNEVDIELLAIGTLKQSDTPQLYLGARRLCCCKADDYATRIRVIEKLSFGRTESELPRAEQP